MKTLFFGTSEFAVPSLELVARRTELYAVVTQPDRPAGRGQKLRPSPVKETAKRLGIRVFEPVSLRGFKGELAQEEFDLFVLASYGKIVPKELLDVPRTGSLNVHPSLLPQYRGATPIQTALRDGAAETGVTVMLMDEGLDTGEIVLQERTPILPDENYGRLHDRLARFGAQVLAHALDAVRSGTLPHSPQEGKPTLTRPLKKDDLAIDWDWAAMRVVNHVRALAPKPAARASIAGVSVKVLRAEIARWNRSLVEPGHIAGITGDALIVSCGDGAVNVLELIAPNNPPQTGGAFGAALLARKK